VEAALVREHKKCKTESEQKFPQRAKIIELIQLYQACVSAYIQIIIILTINLNFNFHLINAIIFYLDGLSHYRNVSNQITINN
jgi:hypothetical protein